MNINNNICQIRFDNKNRMTSTHLYEKFIRNFQDVKFSVSFNEIEYVLCN